MASATPSCFCTTQKHLAVKRSRSSIRRFLGACCEVTLQREECEKPWCLTDNALPCDTPQLAAGRLHYKGLRLPPVAPVSRLIELANQTLYEMKGQIQQPRIVFPQIS